MQVLILHSAARSRLADSRRRRRAASPSAFPTSRSSTQPTTRRERAGSRTCDVAYTWILSAAEVAAAPRLKWLHTSAVAVETLALPELFARGVDRQQLARRAGHAHRGARLGSDAGARQAAAVRARAAAGAAMGAERIRGRSPAVAAARPHARAHRRRHHRLADRACWPAPSACTCMAIRRRAGGRATSRACTRCSPTATSTRCSHARMRSSSPRR